MRLMNVFLHLRITERYLQIVLMYYFVALKDTEAAKGDETAIREVLELLESFPFTVSGQKGGIALANIDEQIAKTEEEIRQLQLFIDIKR